MKGIAKFSIVIVTSMVLLTGCVTSDKDPELDSSSLQPTLQQRNQTKLQSAVYQ